MSQRDRASPGPAAVPLGSGSRNHPEHPAEATRAPSLLLGSRAARSCSVPVFASVERRAPGAGIHRRLTCSKPQTLAGKVSHVWEVSESCQTSELPGSSGRLARLAGFVQNKHRQVLAGMKRLSGIDCELSKS